MITYKLTFNEYFDVKARETEHLNILMDNDLCIFIDPYQVANNLENKWALLIYKRSKTFFEKLNRDFIAPNNRKDGLKFLNHLGEAGSFHLGYSDGLKGKGIANTKAEVIYDSLRANKFAQQNISVTNEAHNILLLVKGIGPDNMSDTLANVCRDIFCDFTEMECLKYGIKTYSTKVEFFNATTQEWDMKEVNLPMYNGKSIILVPQFLCSSERSYHVHYNYFIARNKIAKDLIEGVISIKNKEKLIKTLKSGEEKPVVKHIYNTFKKPKDKLIDFVKQYNESLIEFKDYAKEHYPSISPDQLDDLCYN